MLPITEAYLTTNQYSRPGRAINPRGVVLHWTGNEDRGANAMANRNYFESLKGGQGGYASAHYVVDDHQIVLCVPETEMAYHVGSTTYTQDALDRWGSYPNNCLIGIEICVNADGDFHAALANARDLAADICRRRGFDPGSDITTHYAVVGWKHCPEFFVDQSYCDKYFGPGHDPYQEYLNFCQAVKDQLNPVAPPPLPYKPWSCQVHGQEMPCIAKDGKTWILWNCLQVFGLQNSYLGNGVFQVEGRTVQGYIAQDNHTYLPWDEIDPNKITAVPLSDGRFNFIYLSTQEALKMFADIVGHWAANDIEKLKEMGIVSGGQDGLFHPDNNITRAEVAVLINRAIHYIQGNVK